MKLYTAKLAPNPRRVQMFVAEKHLGDRIETVLLDLAKGEHKASPAAAAGPRPALPVLELDDGRQLAESRAICRYLEGLQPEPNLLGRDADEQAFIEMADRQIEYSLLVPAMNAVRHSHPGFAAVESPQFPDFGRAQLERVREAFAWFDARLQGREFVAADRLTIADITLFCTLEFLRGLARLTPGAEGRTHLQAWRDRIAERPSARP